MANSKIPKGPRAPSSSSPVVPGQLAGGGKRRHTQQEQDESQSSRSSPEPSDLQGEHSSTAKRLRSSKPLHKASAAAVTGQDQITPAKLKSVGWVKKATRLFEAKPGASTFQKHLKKKGSNDRNFEIGEDKAHRGSPTIENQVVEQYLEQQAKTRKEERRKKSGLSSDFYIGGAVQLPDANERFCQIGNLMRSLSDAPNKSGVPIEKKEGKSVIRLAKVTKEFIEEISHCSEFPAWLRFISTVDKIPVRFSNEQGVSSGKKTGTFRHAETLLLRNKEGRAEDVSTNEILETPANAALALKFMCAGDISTAIKIIATAPDSILTEICDLSFYGNIFSSDIVIRLIKTLITAAAKNDPNSELMISHQEGLEKCIKHYLAHSPFENLQPATGYVQNLTRSSLTKQHLLVQNPDMFLDEVCILLSKIIGMGPQEPEAQPSSVAAAGRQSAFLLGTTFRYVQDFSENLSFDQMKIKSRIKALGTAIKVAGKATSSVPLAGGLVDGVVEETSDYVFKLLAVKATSVEPRLDLEGLAENLITLTKNLRWFGFQGLIVPGEAEPTTETRARALINAEDEGEDNLQYTRLGKVFAESFEVGFSKFYTDRLESDIKKASAQVEVKS